MELNHSGDREKIFLLSKNYKYKEHQVSGAFGELVD